MTKLTGALIAEIRTMLAETDLTKVEIAEAYGVSPERITQVGKDVVRPEAFLLRRGRMAMAAAAKARRTREAAALS